MYAPILMIVHSICRSGLEDRVSKAESLSGKVKASQVSTATPNRLGGRPRWNSEDLGWDMDLPTQWASERNGSKWVSQYHHRWTGALFRPPVLSRLRLQSLPRTSSCSLVSTPTRPPLEGCCLLRKITHAGGRQQQA